MRTKRFNMILVLCLTFLTLTSCAAFEDLFSGIGSAFRGNTKKDPTDYSLDEKREYRKYLYKKKIDDKLKEEEIIRQLNKEEEKKINTR